MEKTNFIDKKKFSPQHLKDIIGTNNRNAEFSSNYGKEQDCLQIKQALTTLINTEYYYEVVRPRDPKREVITSNTFRIRQLKFLEDIKSECEVDFPAISRDLSELMKEKLEISLFKSTNISSEYYIQLENKKIKL